MKSLARILALLILAAVPVRAADRPNIVLVLADDLGFGDLACFGSKIVRSPNLDRFAADGLRLTSCYAGNANCSPSRAALMTGRTPMRAGIRTAIPIDSPMHLRRGEVTIAGLLKNAGYATAHVGKWHLNGKFNQPVQPQPGDHGFEHWFSTQNNALPNHRNPVNFVRNGKPVGKLDGFAGHLVVDEAIRWLDAGRDKTKPFFLYTCFHEPHEPIATDAKYSQLHPSADPSYSAYHGNIAQMDDAFGRLMRALDERGLRENTLVWFTSDNGPALTPMHPHGSAGPLRDKKGSLWEGGIRVPGIVRWPGRIAPGRIAPGRIAPGRVSDEPVSGVDFLSTVCAITGIAPPRDRTLDGASIVPIFEGKPIARTTPLYWHFVHASGEPKVAIRHGSWKLLASFGPAGPRNLDIDERSESEVKTAEPQKFFLHDLSRDIGEAKDLSADEPGKLAEMRALLDAKYREVRAETPTWPHWKFVNLESEQIEWPDYYLKKKAQGRAGAPKQGDTKRLDLGGGVTLEVVFIPPGEFMMGSTPEEKAWATGIEGGATPGTTRESFEGEQPRLTRVRSGFWMGRTEVSVGQFRRFVDESGFVTDAEKPGGETQVFDPEWDGYHLTTKVVHPWKSVKGKGWRDPNWGFANRDDFPVVCVSYNDMKAFCQWLTERERKSGRLPEGWEYRLPTEAEWEYGCRGGSKESRYFWWGNELEDGEGRLNISAVDFLPGRKKTWPLAKAPWSDGFAFVSPVDHYGEKGRNGFGLADMCGGVWEFVLDHFDPKGGHEDVHFEDAQRRTVTRPVCRGGNYFDVPGNARCAVRLGIKSVTYSDSRDGFRICLGRPVTVEPAR